MTKLPPDETVEKLKTAQRLLRFADVVGRENVIAAPDCGFGTFAFRPPRV